MTYDDEYRFLKGIDATYAGERNPTQKDANQVGEKLASWPIIGIQSELSKAAEMLHSGGQVFVLQKKIIGNILNSLGVIDGKTLLSIDPKRSTTMDKGKPIGEILVQMGLLEAEELTRALCIQSGVPMVDVLSIHIPYNVLYLIPEKVLKEKEVVPVGIYNRTLYLAMADPFAFSDQSYFALITKLKIKPVFAPFHEIDMFHDTKWSVSASDYWAG